MRLRTRDEMSRSREMIGEYAAQHGLIPRAMRDHVIHFAG
jgi:hypothetical protein